jgi:hypothetical protein
MSETAATVAPFVGTDPDETVEVKHGGATFTVGVIDYGRWLRIDAEQRGLYRDALRVTIKRLTEEGKDSGEVVHTTADGHQLTRAQMDALNEPAYRERLHRVMLEAARYAVKGFTGWARKNGQPVPCKFEAKDVDGITFRVLHEETMEFLRFNAPVVIALWPVIQRLQEVREEEKKA